MKLDRAPYELTSMPITLQPLQFPHSRKLQTGVKLASPTAQSKVSSTQSELAYVEQALKLSMHAISNTMYYTDFSKVKQRGKTCGSQTGKTVSTRTQRLTLLRT